MKKIRPKIAFWFMREGIGMKLAALSHMIDFDEGTIGHHLAEIYYRFGDVYFQIGCSFVTKEDLR